MVNVRDSGLGMRGSGLGTRDSGKCDWMSVDFGKRGFLLPATLFSASPEPRIPSPVLSANLESRTLNHFFSANPKSLTPNPEIFDQGQHVTAMVKHRDRGVFTQHSKGAVDGRLRRLNRREADVALSLAADAG